MKCIYKDLINLRKKDWIKNISFPATGYVWKQKLQEKDNSGLPMEKKKQILFSSADLLHNELGNKYPPFKKTQPWLKLHIGEDIQGHSALLEYHRQSSGQQSLKSTAWFNTALHSWTAVQPQEPGPQL